MLLFGKIIMNLRGLVSVYLKLHPSAFFVLSASLVLSSCLDFPPPKPKASAPLNPVTSQSYQKVFGNGDTLADAAET